MLWAFFVTKFVAKYFQKSPNLVTLIERQSEAALLLCPNQPSDSVQNLTYDVVIRIASLLLLCLTVDVL